MPDDEWQDAENTDLREHETQKELSEGKKKKESMEDEIQRESRGDVRAGGRTLIGSEGP